jgi:hypothetical protein
MISDRTPMTPNKKGRFFKLVDHYMELANGKLSLRLFPELSSVEGMDKGGEQLVDALTRQFGEASAYKGLLRIANQNENMRKDVKGSAYPFVEITLSND